MSKETTKTVLVVEQDPLNRKLFKDVLEASGFLALGCEDSRQTVPLIKRHKPDCILLNIRYPGEEDLALVREIKSAKAISSIPIVAVTAMALNGDDERILAAGCDACLIKPVPMASLTDTIRRLSKINSEQA